MKIIYILLGILLSTSCLALLCEDSTTPLSDCLVLTDVLDCSTTATILNVNGSSYSQNMSLVSNGIYNFSFSYAIGDYSIILCDNSSSQINVRTSSSSTALDWIYEYLYNSTDHEKESGFAWDLWNHFQRSIHFISP